MNNTFSMHRVALYARKHYAENSRSYLYGLLALATMSAVALYIRPYDFNENLLLLLLLGSAYFTMTGSRSHYSRRAMAQSYTLPVSPAEKYLFTWFNSAVVATVAAFAVVLGVCLLFSAIYERPVGLDLTHIELPVVGFAMTAYFLFQAAALLSCCWSIGSPIKIFLLIIGLFIACALIGVYSLKTSPDANFTINTFDATCSIRSATARIRYPLAGGFSLPTNLMLLFGFWTSVMWVTAYFKFRERTVK